MSLDAHFKELSNDIFFMTYTPYFVDQNYKSKFDTEELYEIPFRPFL